MNSKKDRIRKAGKECAGGADISLEEKIRGLGTRDIDSIMDQLLQKGIPQAEVNRLRAEIDQATDKNKAILSVANGFIAVSKAVKDILQKWFS